MDENNIEKENTKIDPEQTQFINELKKSKDEAEKNWDLFIRAKAEIENIKKRTDNEITNIQKHSLKNLFVDLLPLLDSFELCLNNVNQKNISDNEGFNLLYKMLVSILTKYNVKKMEINKYTDLDPAKHEVISTIANDDYNNVIESVFLSGYILHDQVLRYAKVSIFKKENNQQ